MAKPSLMGAANDETDSQIILDRGRIQTEFSISMGFENKRARNGELMDLTLCRRCEGHFRDSDYLVVKKGWQNIKERCDFCQSRLGLLFGVFGRPQR